MSIFASVEMAPGDPILGLTEAYLADPRPNKVNLGVGIYTDEQGRVPVLKAVQQVEQALARGTQPRGYLPIDGLPAYNTLSQQLLFGAESPLLAAGRVATAQTIGGSARLRVAADLLRQVGGAGANIAISNPSWGNHHVVFRTAGFELLDYRYYDDATHGLDFAGMLEDLGKLEPGTVVLLHACCHNPTGVDLDAEQWAAGGGAGEGAQAAAVHRHGLPGLRPGHRCRRHRHAPVGGVGDRGVRGRQLVFQVVLAVRRAGGRAVDDRCRPGRGRAAASKIKQTIRANYSSPAAHGAPAGRRRAGQHRAARAVGEELGEMRERIHAMRAGAGGAAGGARRTPTSASSSARPACSPIPA